MFNEKTKSFFSINTVFYTEYKLKTKIFIKGKFRSFKMYLYTYFRV